MNATRICSAEGCDRTDRIVKGYCKKHYARLYKHGHIEPTRIQGDDKARLLSYTEKTESCWNWMGLKNDLGYGRIRINGKAERAHRVAYQLLVGPIPEGAWVDHICRNTGCVRPEHLRPVTPKQNGENRGPNRNGIGIRGVTFHAGKYTAQLKHNRKAYYLGRYDTAEEAGEVARLKRLELFTHNDPDRI